MPTPPPDDQREAVVLHDFLLLLVAHRDQGQERELGWYLQRFPGHDCTLAQEYLAAFAKRGETTGGLFAGRYEVIRELGRGGQGVVFLARDTQLHRLVALKTIEASGRQLQRLRREADIASHLEHPGICALYEADFDHVPAYVSFRYVDGWSLHELLESRRGGTSGVSAKTSIGLGPRSSAELASQLGVLERVARALHAAHEQGVVHRDIKPSNLMVTPAGDPVLLDFGLASHGEPGTPTLTLTGEALGTPAYMAPEQIRGESGLSRSTDVFALGVVIYESLTLRRPFDGPSRSAIEQAVLESAPVRASRHNRALPSELDAILATALDPDPARRYATAGDLADDLRRLRLHEPILASPPSTLRRAQRWSQRNPQAATALVALSLLMLLVVQLFVTAKRRGDERLTEALIREALEEAPSNPGYALAVAQEVYRRAPDTGLFNDALLQVLQHHRELTPIVPPADIQPDQSQSLDLWNLFGWDVEDAAAVGSFHDEWVLMRTTDWRHRTRGLHDHPIVRVDLSPDARRLLFGDARGSVVLVDTESGAVLATSASTGAAVSFLRCAWGAGRVFVGDVDGRLGLWELEDGHAPEPWHQYTGAVEYDGLLTADESRLITFDEPIDDRPGGALVHVWDASGGELLHTFTGHDDIITAVACSRDGRWLASASLDATARVWDLVHGKSVTSLPHPGKVLDLDLNAEGTLLATGCDSGDVASSSGDSAFLWSWQSADAPRPLPQRGRRSTYAVAFDAATDRLATGNINGSITIWDSRSAEVLDRCLTAHGTNYLDWTDSSEQLVAVAGGRCNGWSLGRQLPLLLAGHLGPVLRARFLVDGSRIVTASADGTAKLWDVASGQCVQTLQHDSVVRWVEPGPAGRLLLTGCDNGDAFLFQGDDRVASMRHEGAVTQGRFVGSDRVVTSTDAGEILLWDSTGQLLHAWSGHVGPIQRLRVSPDGSRVASAGSDRSVRIWEPGQSGSVMVSTHWDATRTASTQGRVYDLIWCADGESLWASAEDRTLNRLSLTGASLARAPVSGSVGWIVQAPEGRLVALKKWMPQAQVHSRTGSVVRGPPHHGRVGSSSHMTIGPHGLILTAIGDKADIVRIDDTQLVRHVLFSAHRDVVTHGDFSPDGELVVTASADGTAWLWPVFPAKVMPAARSLTERERASLGLDGGLFR